MSVSEALKTCTRILDKCSYVPEKAERMARYVRAIRQTIYVKQRVSLRQEAALDRMNRALEKMQYVLM